MTIQPPTLDQVRNTWDTIAPRFDQYITPSAIGQGAAFLDHLEIAPGTWFLDVACGSGAVAIPAARRGAQVIAVDIAPRMIELLEARARAEGLAIEGRVADAHGLDLPDDAFDVAASQNGVTMSAGLPIALAEMTRVTRPGGTVGVAAFGPLPKVEFLSMFFAGIRAAVPGFAGLPVDPPPPPFQLADATVFAQALARAGLHDVSVGTAAWDLPINSGTELWNAVTSSNPIAAKMVAGLTDDQRAEVCAILDGVLRERFGGRGDGVLHSAMNVGTGTVPPETR